MHEGAYIGNDWVFEFMAETKKQTGDEFMCVNEI